jgi:hypothetical protein
VVITAPSGSPQFAHDLARSAQTAVDDIAQVFISNQAFTVATLPAASRFIYKMAIVSDGAGNKFVVISNGTAWYYLEGSAA